MEKYYLFDESGFRLRKQIVESRIQDPTSLPHINSWSHVCHFLAKVCHLQMQADSNNSLEAHMWPWSKLLMALPAWSGIPFLHTFQFFVHLYAPLYLHVQWLPPCVIMCHRESMGHSVLSGPTQNSVMGECLLCQLPSRKTKFMWLMLEKKNNTAGEVESSLVLPKGRKSHLSWPHV